MRILNLHFFTVFILSTTNISNYYNTLKKAKIIKPVHWLQHSYAIHLLESGTDLGFIQELLRHSSGETTLEFTRTSVQQACKT